jgi:colanic acid biosynthesis glycosyl transferase WcaI
MGLQKSITIITGNYFPEDTAIGLYTTQFAQYLVKNNFKVSIITGFPYYPKWEIYEDYKDKNNYYYENINNIDVFRYKIFVPKKVTFFGRIKLMLSFLKGTLKNYKKINHSDLVICIIPFTLSIIPAYLLSKKFKTKLWVHVQDFEFDLAFESGIFNKKYISFLKFLIRKLEKYLLNRAFIISTISKNMLLNVVKKAPKKESYFFPNWISSNNINPDNFNQHKYIKKDKFSILYSGNIGNKQDWDCFIELCKLINDESIEITIVGQGAYINDLKNRCINYDFVRFYEPVPYNELNDLLCSANLHFLFQKTDVLDTVMPSKILGMMASNKPSLVTGNNLSEVKSIFEESNCGYYFSNNNVEEILEKIIYLKNNQEVTSKLGKNGRDYVLNNFSEEAILSNVKEKIDSLIISNLVSNDQ